MKFIMSKRLESILPISLYTKISMSIVLGMYYKALQNYLKAVIRSIFFSNFELNTTNGRSIFIN